MTVLSIRQSRIAEPEPDQVESPEQAPLDTVQRRRRLIGLVLALATLIVVMVLSIMIGSKPISLGHVFDAFTSYDGSEDAIIVRQQRVPRTLVAILVGIALGVAGALMQGLTRNPLADPGLLGVSAGSAFAMTVAVGTLSITSTLGYVWFSFLGAIVTTVVVYLLGTAGRTGGSPITLALAGVSIGAVLAGLTETITLLDEQAFIALRVWDAGGLANRGWDIIATIAPFIGLGLLLAAFAARGLNVVALGEDLATSLGANQRRTRILVMVSVTLLCGAATAAVGPIWFIGLMVPHAARWIVGPDQRWIFAYTMLLAPILMLASDVLGRVLVPGELEAGLVTAFIGGPALIWLIRRSSVRSL